MKLTDLKTSEQVLAEELRDPDFKREWDRTALARAVALKVLAYRIEHSPLPTRSSETARNDPATTRTPRGRRAQPHDRHPRAPRASTRHRVRDRRPPTPTTTQAPQRTSTRQKHDRLLPDRHSCGTAGSGVRSPPAGSPAISVDCWLPSLILGLEHPTSLTGDTHFRFGRVVLLSPIQNHPSHPHPSTFPSQPLGEIDRMGQIDP